MFSGGLFHDQSRFRIRKKKTLIFAFTGGFLEVRSKPPIMRRFVALADFVIGVLLESNVTTPPKITKEIRSSPRVPLELKVEYRRMNTFFSDYTRNISLGGTFIATKAPMPIGTRFKFILSIPSSDEHFELLGEVTWAKAIGDNAGMGICYIWEDEDKRKAFEAQVEALMVENLGSEIARRLLKKDK